MLHDKFKMRAIPRIVGLVGRITIMPAGTVLFVPAAGVGQPVAEGRFWRAQFWRSHFHQTGPMFNPCPGRKHRLQVASAWA